jgi:hypothetical protein
VLKEKISEEHSIIFAGRIELTWLLCRKPDVVVTLLEKPSRALASNTI